MHDLAFLFLLTEEAKEDFTSFSITLIDDDDMFAETLKDFLISMKITKIERFERPEDFLATVHKDDQRLIILDYDFGSKSSYTGLTALEAIRQKNPALPVIMLSAQDNMAKAIETLRKGALDYFIKGTENAFTSVLSSILKINELQKLKQSHKEHALTVSIVGVAFVVMTCMFLWQYFK